MKRVKRLISLLALLPLLLLLPSCGNTDDGNTAVDFSGYRIYQTMEGFGASSAWTFQLLDESNSDEAVNLLYGDDGLSMNIYRYNIGAGSADAVFDDLYPYNTAWFNRERRAESFFTADKFQNADSFSDVSNYDFSRDAASRRAFRKSLQTGNIDRVVFFANSPHYLMTASGKTTGDTAHQNNLKEEYYEAFCDYLLIIVNELYKTELLSLEKIPEIFISPVNEPQWSWGGEGASQEGCHFDAKELARFFKVFLDKLDAFNAENGTDFIPDAFESGSITYLNIYDYLSELDKQGCLDRLSHLSVHSYHNGMSEPLRTSFVSTVAKYDSEIKISSTEYCDMRGGRDDSVDSALHLAKIMALDINLLNATDWSWWIALSVYNYNDGLIYMDKPYGNGFTVAKRYYAMAHFSKYVNKGDVRIDFPDGKTEGFDGLTYSAFKKADNSVVIVIVNEGEARTVGINEAFKTYVKITTDSNENLAAEQGNFNGQTIISEKSVTTLILK